MTKHKYKRRTYDEAVELAKEAFQAGFEANLSQGDIEEMKLSCAETGGSPKDFWEDILGFKPTDTDFYEVELYKPSNECPYIEKSYVKILVPRDRNTYKCKLLWKQPVPKYDGPWFS